MHQLAHLAPQLRQARGWQPWVLDPVQGVAEASSEPLDGEGPASALRNPAWAHMGMCMRGTGHIF